jgi:hypothetical protein
MAGGWQLNPQPKHRLPYGHPPVHSYGRSYGYGHPVVIIIQQPKSSKSSGYYSRGYSGLGRIYYPHHFKSQKGSRYTVPNRR